MNALIIKKGANGICVFIFIFFFENSIKPNTTSEPIQKESIVAQRPRAGPSIQPMPSISLASPSPIQRPRDPSHNRANGKANNGPINTCMREGVTNNDPTPV